MPGPATSATAYVVTATVAKLGRLPEWEGRMPDRAVEFAAAFALHARDSWFKRAVHRTPARVLERLLDALVVPGMGRHYILRKLWIQQRVERAIADGAGQVLVLGAGFDSLALRLAGAHPDVAFVEVDLPHTQRAKLAALRRMAAALPRNLAFTPADLAESTLGAALDSQPAFRPSRATVVVLEGVLMYLTEAAVRALFAALRGLVRAELTVVFGATHASDDVGAAGLRVTNAVLARHHEGTRWHCPSAQMEPFLEAVGYRLRERVLYGELQRPFARGARPVPAEDENYFVATCDARGRVTES